MAPKKDEDSSWHRADNVDVIFMSSGHVCLSTATPPVALAPDNNGLVASKTTTRVNVVVMSVTLDCHLKRVPSKRKPNTIYIDIDIYIYIDNTIWYVTVQIVKLK